MTQRQISREVKTAARTAVGLLKNGEIQDTAPQTLVKALDIDIELAEKVSNEIRFLNQAYDVLTVIATKKKEDRMTFGSLRREIGISRSALNQIIDFLEEHKLVSGLFFDRRS